MLPVKVKWEGGRLMVLDRIGPDLESEIGAWNEGWAPDGQTRCRHADRRSETVTVVAGSCQARGGWLAVAVRAHHSFPIRHGAPDRAPPAVAKQGKALTYI